MNIKFRIDSLKKIADLKSDIKLFYNEVNAGNYLNKLAPLVNSSIQIRVQESGKGVTNSMPKYSDKYAIRRAKTGRQISYRDLTYSGNMFASLRHRVEGRRAILFFGGLAESKKARKQEIWKNVYKYSYPIIGLVLAGIIITK
jgi:hypothetical protein